MKLLARRKAREEQQDAVLAKLVDLTSRLETTVVRLESMADLERNDAR